MKKNNKFLVLTIILLFSLFSKIALSEETVEVPIQIKWDVSDQSELSDVSNTTMDFSSCSNNNYGYGGDGFDAQNHVYTIYTDGPFPEDQRTSCKLAGNDVYFNIDKLVINFTYNGQPYSCTITQGVGTSYDHRYNQYDKLQGGDSGNWWACDSKNLFKYKINSGQDYPLFIGLNPGSIEIQPIS